MIDEESDSNTKIMYYLDFLEQLEHVKLFLITKKLAKIKENLNFLEI